MSKQHLIALDLDGTLLTEEKNISERTKSVIAKAQQQGHIICIATGRPYRASIQYYTELNLKTPIVNFNGAFIHHPLDSSFGHHHSPLDLKTAKTIIETCEAFQVENVMVEIIDDFYLRYYDEIFINTITMGQNPIGFGNLTTMLKDNPTTLLIRPHNHQKDQLFDLLKDAHAEVIDQRVWAAPWNIIEVIRSGINKAIGLKQIADHFHIPKERIIAFGDEENDFEMLEFAGTGVAMKNAIDSLKNIANHITDSNEEDGIATFLEDKLNL